MKLELEARKGIGMRLALVQMPNYGSKDENLYKSLQAIEIASKQGADLVLFPEVQLTEFFPQYPGQDAHKYAVTIEGETVKNFATYAGTIRFRQYLIYIFLKMTGHMMQVFSLIKTVK